MIKFSKFAAACAAVCSFDAFGATCIYDGAWDVTPSGETDEIVIVSGDLTWGASLPHKVASWTQTGGKVTFETTYAATFPLFEVAGNVSLTGGTWTHAANSSTEKYRLNVACGGNFTIGATAEINVDVKGYNNAGPGRANNHSGGSYGGFCDNFASVTAYGRCYGSIASPVNIGSAYSSTGGGAIRLNVSGTLTVDGHVYARGSREVVSYYGGSGGSVWLTAAAIVGAETGRIAADGGLASASYFAAGGRVSLCQTGSATDFSAYLGTVTADGARKEAEGAYAGSPGTVYYELASDGRGKGALVIDAHNTTYKRSDFFIAEQDEGFSPKSITLRNGVTLNVFGDDTPGNLTFAFNGKLVMDGSATLGFGKGAAVDLRGMTTEVLGSGTHTLELGGKNIRVVSDARMTLDGLVVKISETGLDWTLDTLVCTNGGGLVVNAPNTLAVSCLRVVKGGVVTSNKALTIPGDVAVENGGVIRHDANTKDSDNRIDWSVGGDLTVAAGGWIDAWGRGWPTQVGTGSGSDSWGGGGHGGIGYNASDRVSSAGECYGSLTKPVSLGSGSSSQLGGPGGGAVKLTVAGDFVNNGLVDADGGIGQYGAGPGGSVWITAKTLAGAGKIEANGNGTNCVNTICSHAAGAGGRVAVWLTDPAADFSVFTGAITAYGSRGSRFSHAAGSGTVYLKTGAQAANEGTLYVDNGTVPANTTTDIGRYVTDAEVGSVVIAANGRLRLRDSSVLTVHGDISCAGSFTAIDDATLVFAGSGASSVDCDLNVPRLTCMEPGKEIVFDAGKTVTVGKKLTLEGEEGNLVTVMTTEGSMWNLVVGAEAEQSVKRVRVEGCDASAGAEIIATDSEKDDVTKNWKTVNVVPGETITWTGAAGATGWTLLANWDKERPPAETDFVVINSAAVQPILTADVVVSNLTIAAGASLALDGFDLAVNGDLIVNGRLTASAAERIRVTGNVVFGTNAFVKDHSTVTLVGSAAQSFFAGGNSFYNLVFDNTSADGVTVGSSFEANYLTVAPEVPTAISFASGVTVTVGASLALTGDATAKNLTLGPTVEDATWDLMVKGTAEIRGVTVSGSQATGNDIYASDSVDAGGNAKWHFGTFSAAKWVGETSDTFDEPSNWEGGVVPDADTAVEVDTAKPLKITSETTVREIVVGGSAAASVAVKAPLTVVGAMVLRDRATVTADAKVTVGGSLVMNAGSTLTYTGKSAAKRLELEAAGDVSVEADAFITADEKGPTDPYLGRADNSGASHGGMGGTHGTAANCYGSVFCPTNAGSSVASDSAGGGIIRMTVAGAIFVDGAIRANGGYRGGFYGTSGGSVWLTCGRFLGNGTVSANGGSSANTYRGAGGRVAVYLTDPGASFNDFAGRVAADPSDLKGAPGTVYVQTADEADYCGTVKIVNNPNAVELGGSEQGSFVQYPMRSRSAADPQRGKMKIELGERVRFSLTEDAAVGDLVVNGERPKIFLNGHTLKVRKVASKAEQERIRARVQDADKGGGILWPKALLVIVK